MIGLEEPESRLFSRHVSVAGNYWKYKWRKAYLNKVGNETNEMRKTKKKEKPKAMQSHPTPSHRTKEIKTNANVCFFLIIKKDRQ